MDEEEIRIALEIEEDPQEIAHLLWLLYGDSFFSSAEQNSVYLAFLLGNYGINSC